FLACRFIEALVYRYGFAGLREGMKAFLGMVDRNWDELRPIVGDSPEEQADTIDTAFKAKGLIACLAQVPVVKGPGGAFSYLDFLDSQRNAETKEAYDKSLNAIKKEPFLKEADALNEAYESIVPLQNVLRDRLQGTQPPSLNDFVTELGKV